MSGQIAIRLNGGPLSLDGWTNIYDAEQLGGWPPPDEIVAFPVGGVVAVARPEVAATFTDISMATRYRKVHQSQLTDADEAEMSHVVRGAEYEVVE